MFRVLNALGGLANRRSNLSIFNGVAQIRQINHCLHIKGLPKDLSKEEIYDFMKDYGTIQELATYVEAPKADKSQENIKTKRRFHITHNREPGQTAIVRYHEVQSAVMCKNELHWRPFPHENYCLTDEIIKMYPRDRPLINILYETEHLFLRLRPWVRRDLFDSRIWIADIEGKPVEEGEDKGLQISRKQEMKNRQHGHKRSKRIPKFDQSTN